MRMIGKVCIGVVLSFALMAAAPSRATVAEACGGCGHSHYHSCYHSCWGHSHHHSCYSHHSCHSHHYCHWHSHGCGW